MARATRLLNGFRVLTALFITASLTQCHASELTPQAASEQAVAKLRSVSTVEFFFVGRTEHWDYTSDQLVDESSIRVSRDCGGNCHNFMKPILEHLRAAIPAKCSKGNQDVLIRAAGNFELTYSYSGRQIRYAGRCFFNEQSVREVVSGGSMLFH